MHKPLLAALALTAAITTQAKADYVWQFVPTKVTAMTADGMGYGPIPGISHKEAASWLPEFRIEITDRAFASRSLSLNWGNCDYGYCGSGPTGDFSKIVAFNGFYGVNPNTLYGWGIIDTAWTKRGKMTGDIELLGDVTDLTLTSVPLSNKWEGFYASDGSECGMQAMRCDLTGHWAFLGDPPASVPEPASFALLAAGILGIGAVRRKMA